MQFQTSIWVRNETDLKTICDRTKVKYQDAEDIEPWCYVAEDAPIDQKHSCISLLSARDVSFSYSPCNKSYSALCKTTEKICHPPVTIKSRSNTSKFLTSLNATELMSESNSTNVSRFNSRTSLISEGRTNSESTTTQKRNQDTSLSISSNSPSAGGKKNFLQFNVETRIFNPVIYIVFDDYITPFF